MALSGEGAYLARWQFGKHLFAGMVSRMRRFAEINDDSDISDARIKCAER